MLSKHPLHQPELHQPPKEYPSKGTPLSTADSRTWRHSSGRPMCISLKVCTTHWRASNCGCSVSSMPILISRHRCHACIVELSLSAKCWCGALQLWHHGPTDFETRR
ncbi:hypothetical protein I3760_04G064400 [Carya illinoinensis]|nr:hypothetical protein I3760_04G064400 [Carya illinoinensis]